MWKRDGILGHYFSEVTDALSIHVIYESDLACLCVTSCLWVRTAVFFCLSVGLILRWDSAAKRSLRGMYAGYVGTGFLSEGCRWAKMLNCIQKYCSSEIPANSLRSRICLPEALSWSCSCHVSGSASCFALLSPRWKRCSFCVWFLKQMLMR